MSEADTVKLLKECDAGIKMGVASISEVLDEVSNPAFRYYLKDCKSEHQKLEKEVEHLLEMYHDEGKELSPMAKVMSWMKTNVRLAMDESDHTIAEVMIDGCNMGVKSLNQYLNHFEEADEEAKNIANKLIMLEEKLVSDMYQYL